ncbi:DUF4041 domain-containing protein [Agarivorans sp. 1_MG-2023]|uniref:DUF4041 domain-containing protein n=1 Tax=unclassified Agarivorans TaxID=2636026 RepID=UPI0026E16D0F|nr:DUF4041 domain-containing protein [Agarivorans sp. 1_MG-2023]MDO6765566.1 DUF4041 domain-containing protein [Agarivorans sp. 1_MG-2023]
MPETLFQSLPSLPFIVATGVLFIALVVAVAKLNSIKKQLSSTKEETAASYQALADYEQKFSGVIDIDKEVELRKKQLSEYQKEAELKYAQTNENITGLQTQYKQKKTIFDSLVHQIGIYNDDAELLELGFYESHFDFETSEAFKGEIRECKEEQKQLLRDKGTTGAIYCTTEWTVGDSKAEGRKMTNRGIRLTARAFNNECEAAIANCTWKNAVKMEARIQKAFEAINNLNESNRVIISDEYLKLKLKELRLTHEYKEKKQREKEEQAEIKAQMREEAKIEAEIKKAEQEAIKEEARYQKALKVAQKQLESASEEAKAQLEAQIAQLQSDLESAEQKHQRAQSMAEQTKQGHVYIISNIGSFGEDVYKIGMTRRLEPMDRVKELGDASVPFSFDVHAMIHTKDAPSLEKGLHRQFDNKRLNMVNRRKEFFNVDLAEIKQAVEQFSNEEASFIETAVAQDYYETKAMLKQAGIKEALRSGQTVIDTESKGPVFSESI